MLQQAGCVVYLKSTPCIFMCSETAPLCAAAHLKRVWQNRKAALKDVRDFLRLQGAEKQYERELEYLYFEHLYFVPSKEIVLKDRANPCLKTWRVCLEEEFPNWKQNPYISMKLSRKDKILLALLNHRCYVGMCVLSDLRKKLDQMRNKVTGDK